MRETAASPLSDAARAARQGGGGLRVGLAGASLSLIIFAPVAAYAQPDGGALFQQNCAACHQKHGEGIKGAFPALAGDALVQGPPDVVAQTVLHGRGGMPAFAPDLSDDTLAAILTYVRSAWGNKAAPIAPAVFAAQRSAGVVNNDGLVPQAH